MMNVVDVQFVHVPVYLVHLDHVPVLVVHLMVNVVNNDL